MCFDFLYNFFSEIYLIIRETERETITCIGLHVKYSLFLSDFIEILIQSAYVYFLKLLKYQIPWKSVQW
jgi:hypothetical protein